MHHKRLSIGLASGLLTALLGSAAWPGDAVAQGRPGEAIGGFTTTVRPATPAPARPPRVQRADPDAPEPAQAATPDPQPPTDGADQAATDSTDPDSDNPPPRLRFGRRPVVDGDMSWPPEQPSPRDGVMETDDGQTVPDGVDPNQLDTRDPEDIAAFERPAAGFDPDPFAADAFAVETEPILDRRPRTLARFEPYQPVGIRRGSFIILPEAEFGAIGYNNLFRSSINVRRDVALDIRPTVRVVSAWRRHALEFRATGITTFHAEFPKEDDRAFTVESRGRIDITRRTNVEVLASFDRAQELRGSLNAAATGTRAEIDTSRAQVAFNHRFNRLSLQLRGSVVETDYSSTIDGAGGFVSNDSRDRSVHEAAVRATWAFKPEFAVFTEVVLNERLYHAAPADGIKRNSTGDRTRVGVSFGNTGQRLRGEIAVGYANQRFEDARLQGIDGIILDANAAWRISGLTSLLFTARSDIAESTLVGSGGGLSQTAGLELRHAFRRHLIGTAGVTLAKQEYQGVQLSERSITSLAGLEYYVNREVTLFGRYQHVDFESTNVGRNYNYDEVRVGVRVRR